MAGKATMAVTLEGLAAAIVEITEDAQDVAVRPLPTAKKNRAAAIAALRRCGDDLSVLAGAMDVLRRRCR